MNNLTILKTGRSLRIVADGKEIFGIVSYKLEQKNIDQFPELTVTQAVMGEVKIEIE